MSNTFGKTFAAGNGCDIETQSTEQQIDDDWEKMYLDKDDTEQWQTRFIPQIEDEQENVHLDIDDNEQCQDIPYIPQIEVEFLSVENQTENPIANITKASTRAHNQFGAGENVHFSSNYDESQSLSLHSQNEDDWVKMYSNDDGTFIDDNSSYCSSSFGAFEFQNGDDLVEINHIVDGEEYEEEPFDDQEDEDQAAAVDVNDAIPALPPKNKGGNRDSSMPQSEVSGRRIVDIVHVFKQIQVTGKHKKDCHFEDMILQQEIKTGFSSIFVFKCGVCGITSRVESDQKKKTALGINRDTVLGIYSVGMGFSHVEEVCSNWDVPSMSYSLFRSTEKVQQEDWLKLAKEESLKALLEEIELAKASGRVDSKGNALIKIITDGSWGKRSYGKFFSSLSGCAVIIGLHTNKVIFFDTRNKYCHTCKLAEVRKLPVKEHKCNKNYSGPSSGMESDIIVQGFKECDVLGARFNVMISDGDSNTYKLIRDLRIYKDPDVYVAKLECTNHLYRNFYKKFNNLAFITKFDSGCRKSIITENMRSKISAGIRSATKHWQEVEETLPIKSVMLEKDVLNILDHYLGNHEQCNGYFCTKETLPEAAGNIKRLKDDGLYYEIQSILQSSFGNNAKSLLAGHTNNPAEQLNSYVAKFLGGKRINYSLAGSYTARVAMGVVHFNSGCHASSEYRKSKFGGVSDLAAVEKLENKRKRKCQETALARAKKPRIRRAETEKGVPAYGGDYSDDFEPRALELATNRIMEKLKNNQMNWKTIECLSKEDESFYHEKSRDLLMSHYFSNIVNSRGPKFYPNILAEVLYANSQLGNNAQNRHQRVQEQEALQRFVNIFPKLPLRKSGLFIDKELPFLGASPFKLVGEDHILSIKCPLKDYQKDIDTVNMQFWTTKFNQRTINKKSPWYIELQGDLHVTNRKWAYLMIWLGDLKTQHQVVKVKREDTFFENEMKEKLVFFYKEGMLKELADSRKSRAMELRKYDEATKTFV